MGGELRGDVLAPASSKGTHGYMPERPELHASLSMSGASIRRAQLDVIDMRQLAPTFANDLEVRFESRARRDVKKHQVAPNRAELTLSVAFSTRKPQQYLDSGFRRGDENWRDDGSG